MKREIKRTAPSTPRAIRSRKPTAKLPAKPSKLPKGVPTEALDRAASLFRACGDPARLRLLEVLSTGEQNVTDLAELSDEGLSTISQRLRLLRAEGLVSRRREGKHIYYGLQDGHVLALIKSAIEHAMHPHEPHDNEGDDHD